MTQNEIAFTLGYNAGLMRHTHSPKEIEQRHPNWTAEQVEAYLSGEDDGRHRDSSRLDRIAAGAMNAVLVPLGNTFL